MLKQQCHYLHGHNMISLPNPHSTKTMTTNPLFEFLYEKCKQDPDLLATVVDEYLNGLSIEKHLELEDFLVNNFGDD